jgi:hypothetical protein
VTPGSRISTTYFRAEGWIALTNGVVGDGRALYRAVVDADLEGVVAKRLTDAHEPKHARWHKIVRSVTAAPTGFASGAMSEDERHIRPLGDRRSPIAFGVPLHDARPAADHEPGGGLLSDRSREGCARQGERAADRKRLVVQPLGVPRLDVEVEAGQPVVLLCHRVSTWQPRAGATEDY